MQCCSNFEISQGNENWLEKSTSHDIEIKFTVKQIQVKRVSVQTVGRF